MELRNAEKQLLRWAQHEVDVKLLNKQIYAKLGEDGLIRVHGRIEVIKALPEEMRNPIGFTKPPAGISSSPTYTRNYSSLRLQAADVRGTKGSG